MNWKKSSEKSASFCLDAMVRAAYQLFCSRLERRRETALSAFPGKDRNDMDKKKIRFTVCGCDFCIVTNDKEEYILSLASGTEEKIEKYVQESAGVSVTQAAILTAMEYADENRRKENILDNIKEQLKSYLDDAAKIKAERDHYKEAYEQLTAKSGTGKKN